MLIDINKIIVTDRIRKDFGNIEELAEDIKENTLLNPPVVAPNEDGTYTLVAGERRLRAMRDILGYQQVNVNIVAVRDSEHALLMEISENECRKEFTKTERLDYARRLARIETSKSQQGKRNDLAQDVVRSERNKAANAVAATLGTNRETLRQEQFIEDPRALLDPADFADWDEGKLSTNKAFQRIKAAQRQAERERDQALRELRQASAIQSNLEAEAESLRRQLAERPEPEVVERTVEVEVESEASKRRIAELEHIKRVYSNDNQKLRKRNEEMHKELDRANGILGERSRTADASWDVIALTTATNQYLRLYGGKVWAFEQFDKVDEVTRREFVKAIISLAAFAQNLYQFVTDENKLGV